MSRMSGCPSPSPPVSTIRRGHRSRISNTNGTPKRRASRSAASAAKRCGLEPMTTSGRGSSFSPVRSHARRLNTIWFQNRRGPLPLYGGVFSHTNGTPATSSFRHVSPGPSRVSVWALW